MFVDFFLMDEDLDKFPDLFIAEAFSGGELKEFGLEHGVQYWNETQKVIGRFLRVLALSDNFLLRSWEP